MTSETSELRMHIKDLLRGWREEGLPGRNSLVAAGQELQRWREDRSLEGLWPEPPLFITATLDDGFGFGIEVIEGFAKGVGLQVQRLGLCQSPERIVAACQERRPRLLGLTVLQFDSEEALTEVSQGLPPETVLVVGGAIFGADPELAERTGVHFVARNAASFLRFLLKLENS